MMAKKSNLKENYQKIKDLNAKLDKIDASNIEEVIESLPDLINEFKETNKGFDEIMKELDSMQEIINQQVK